MKLSQILKQIFPEPPAPACNQLTDELAASFFPADSTRLAHMRQASATAKRIVDQMKYDRQLADKIVAAALFHDVGYSERLNNTGLHPLDGAAYLAHCGVDEAVIEAVLWHSSTPIDIKSFPEIEKIYEQFPTPDMDNPVYKCVSYCDFRTSPQGESYTFGQRIVELENRFGPDSIPPETARQVLPYARKAQKYFAETITDRSNTPLPWIFCDIDGTLIEPGKRIDRTSIDAIQRYRNAGGRMTLITGKHLLSIPELMECVGLEDPHAGVNGSLIARNGTPALHGPSLGHHQAIEDTLLEKGINYATYVIDGIWTRANLTEHELNAFTLVGEVLPNFGPTPADKDVIKVLTYSQRKNREQCAFVRELADKYGLSCVRTAEEFLEIGPTGHGKHSAFMQIMAEADWADLNSIAIGDSENDLTMFGFAGLSAAVANAAPEVLPAADLHIPACQESGVAQLLHALTDSAESGNWSIPEEWLARH